MKLLPAKAFRHLEVTRRLMINHPHFSEKRAVVLSELAERFEAQYGATLPEAWIRSRVEPDELLPMTIDEMEYAGETPCCTFDEYGNPRTIWPSEFNEYGTMYAWVDPDPLSPDAVGWDLETGTPVC